MNPISIIFSLLGVIFLVFVIRLLSLTSVGEGFAASPWWVYLIYLAIVFSGIMFVHNWIEDRRQEMKEIEEEGQRVLLKYKKRRQDQKNGNKINHQLGDELANGEKGIPYK